MFWTAAERRLARVINWGWVLAYARRILIFSALVVGAANLLARIFLPRQQVLVFWWVISLVLLLVLLLAIVFARKRFSKVDDARVRLESALHLNSQLSAAHDQVGAYPSIPEKLHLPLKWKWENLLWSLLLSVLIVLSSDWIPLSHREPVRDYKAEKPKEIREMETWIDRLKQEDVVDEAALEKAEEKIEQLLQRPQEQWFQESSMEAAQHLREQLEQDLKKLAQNLKEAQDAVPKDYEDPKSSPLAHPQGMKAMQDALKNMMEKGLKPGEELSQKAEEALQQLSSLSPEDLEKLQEALEKNSKALQEALGNSPDLGEIAGEMLREGKGKTSGEEEKKGGGGEPGEGGIQRGPGEAPLVMKNEASTTSSQALDTIASRLDMERVAAGEALDERTVQPDPKKQQKESGGAEHGGGARTSTTGSNAPISPSLMPQEKAFLREVFR